MTTEAVSRPIDFAAPEQAESAWSFLLFAWRRKWIVVLLTAVGLGCGYLFFLREVPVFQSTAQLLVVHPTAKLPIEGLQVNLGYDSTHALVLRSPMVISRAVEQHNLKALPSLVNNPDPVGTIMSGLTVTAETQNRSSGDVLLLGYSGLSQTDCPQVLNAVVKSYEAFLGSSHENVSREAVTWISQAKDQLDKQLKEEQEAHRKFREGAPLLFQGSSALNTHENLLQQIENVRAEAILENSKLQAKIDFIQTALARGGSREALTLMVGHIQQGEGQQPAGSSKMTTSIDDQLFPQLVEAEMLQERYGPQHPKVLEIKKRIEMTRQHLLGLRTRQEEQEAGKPKPVSEDFFAVYLESLRQQVKMNEQTMAEMSQLAEQEKNAARSLVTAQMTDSQFQETIALKKRMYEAIVKRLEEINLANDTQAAKLQLIHPPGLGIQIKPNLNQIMSASGIIGILCGLGLALLIDRADRRFRSPDEIRNDLGLPVVGHIPVMPVSEPDKKRRKSGAAEEGASEPQLSPVLRVVHHPRGRIAEAYRGVRTALYFSTRGGGHKVIQITSPNPGDGKTTLAANLAVSIGMSGKSVLLLDADFRRARCHRLFGLENTKGVVDVLNGTVELGDAVRATPVPNLSVLPCGTRPDNPSELLTSPKFEELLAVLREKFEFVLVDTPPVLAVTDPLNVVPRADGVLLVMRLTKRARAFTHRALASLEELGANMLGVVVNGIGGGRAYGEQGKYSYGAYGYSQGYGYGGGDGYGYGGEYDYRYAYRDSEDNANSYYEDAEEPATVVANGKARSHGSKA